MYRGPDKSAFVRMLKLAMWLSPAAALVLLLVALFSWRLSGTLAQMLLTCVAVFLGAMLMYVQLRARHRAGPGFAMLLTLGTAAVVASQVSFLTLVWTDFLTSNPMWRLWWVSMVVSVVITHLVVLEAASARRGGPVELVTAVMAVWAGLMVLWLGLRKDMLADVSTAYLWVLVLPALGTGVGSMYLIVRRVLGVSRPGSISKGAAVTGLLMSHLATAVVAYFVGQATAARPAAQSQPAAVAASAGEDVARQLGKTIYAGQSGVATYLGDTRIVSRPPFITAEQIEAIESRLEPGDILLERANWYLSNPGLPGFWKHAALYVGRLEDLKRLGIADDPAVQKHLGDYLKPDDNGRNKTVIEAVSEGVLLNSLTRSLHADYAAVLRPRVSTGHKAKAITRAFANLGKPYDFNFDFEDTGKLVCTQVVYLSYYDVLAFGLQQILGRTTLPANEIARKYASEAGRADRQLDFVLFLDAAAAKSVAVEATEAEFRKSVLRPTEFVENR
jgi:hypothetical protein